MKNNTDVPFYDFDADGFDFAIDQNHDAYINLYELVSEMLLSDGELLKFYILKKYKEREGKVAKQDRPKIEEDFIQEFFILSKIQGISTAVTIFNRQTLVAIATIIESMLDEFFLCIFCSSPEKMYDYIQADDEGKVRGKIDIKEVINSPSRTELLLSLAKQASSKVMQGEFKSTVKRLKKLTIGEEFSKDLLEKISKLNKIRNEIVHELNNIEIVFDDVEKAFETAFELVEYLKQVAKRLEIPVSEISPNDEKES